MVDKDRVMSSTTFTSSSNTTNQTSDLYETGPDVFHIEQVMIFIESGAGSNVEVRIQAGGENLVPDDGAYDIAGDPVWLPVAKVVAGSTTIQAKHDNNSGTNRDVTVLLSGVKGDLPAHAHA